MNRLLFSLQAPDLQQRMISEDKVLFQWIIILTLIRFWLVDALDLIVTYGPDDESLLDPSGWYP